MEQLHKIFKLCGSPSEEYWKKSKLPHATIFKPQHSYKRCVAETLKGLPSSALSLLDTLLAIEPEVRGTTSSALQSEVSFTLLYLHSPIWYLYFPTLNLLVGSYSLSSFYFSLVYALPYKHGPVNITISTLLNCDQTECFRLFDASIHHFF